MLGAKAILDRDLKPSNVGVSVVADGAPQVRIVDFGIAKALGGSSRQGPVTEMGVVIGTPEYMSTEQADLGRRDIDTRTDVVGLMLVSRSSRRTKAERDRHRACPGLRGPHHLAATSN